MPKVIPVPELWDEETSSFISIQNGGLIIEHSLLSLHEWERKWKKPFLTDKPKTIQELVDYVRCMTLNRDEVDDRVYENLPISVLNEIKAYLEDPMTATTICELKHSPGREIVTAEVIYYSMIAYQIPFECASWHLNTLLTLIKVCGVKNGNEKKMGRYENGLRQRELNEQRLKKRRK